MPPRYRTQFPRENHNDLQQDEVYFYVWDDKHRDKILFHDYDKIYLRPGLYEQIFYDRLKCTSPKKVGEILEKTLHEHGKTFTELRVLDFGAGNGMMGEVLKKSGVARLVGADIIPEAKLAAERDRPGVYDEYFVADFTELSSDTQEEIDEWSFDCLTSVAALGFGDIPPSAFYQALRFIKTGGWIAFNIKETFLDRSDKSGFSRFIRELLFSEYLDVFHLEKYRHRLSVEGQPLYYFALVCQKTAEIDEGFLRRHEIEM